MIKKTMPNQYYLRRMLRRWLRWPVPGFAVVAALVASLFAACGGAATNANSGKSNANATAPTTTARQDAFEIVNSYPHDPKAFLQGLVWHDGALYESTGSPSGSVSTLRRVELASGKVTQSIRLAPEYFGEGLTLVDNRLIQITWQSMKGFVYDLATFKQLNEFSYDTEGWGITYDGKNLIMSDGSNTLTYLDPQTFRKVRTISVTMNGRTVDQLNELEFIEGEIWSNVWHSDLILRINPENGRTNSFLNLKGILPPEMKTDPEAVLNGIAYDAQAKRIFVSGKLWPLLFEIKLKTQ